MNSAADAHPDQRASQLQPTGVRWRVLAWLCGFSALTYIGRIAIIQVQEPIEFDLHLTPNQMAYVFSAFSLAYASFEILSGWLGDKFGSRRILITIVLFWIAFTALTGVAWSFVSLIVFRFLFGVGEAGAFPNIGRASREWFPFSVRGLTQGLVWLFARWGGALAPLLMMILAYPLGWRSGFFLISLLGGILLWGFYARFRDKPQEHPDVNDAERALITENRKDSGAPLPLSWSTMLRSPTLWFLSLMYFCSNAGWSFFASWITPYLQKDLHLSGRRWGRTLQGVIAYALGGIFMLVGVLCTPRSVGLAYASLCLSSFVKDFGMAASWSTTIDIGHRYSGTVAGFMNSVGNLGQVVSVPIVAWLALLAGRPGAPSWRISLYYNAAMFFIASVSWLFVDPRKVIVYSKEDQQQRAEASS